MEQKIIHFGDDQALRQAAEHFRQGKKHAFKDESADGINCMIKALGLLEPMKGEDHRLLRAECLYHLGMMEIWRGRYGTAHDNLTEATKLNPKTAVYWAFLAQACMHLGADEKAKFAAREAEALPNSNIILHMLSGIWEHYGDEQLAKQFGDMSAMISQKNPDACYLMGNANYVKNKKDEAFMWYGRAIELEPDHADANYGYGLILSERLQFRESIPYFTKGTKSEMSSPNSLWGKALAHLTLGEYLEGFADHEIRFVFLKQEYGKVLLDERMDKPQWIGERSAPSRIHVYSEQGFGDCIQFCRYVHLLGEMGHQVTFEVDTSMVDLMKRNFPWAAVVPIAKNYPGTDGIGEVDYRIPLGSLPYAFKTTVDNVPFPNAYLFAEPEKIKEWPIIRNSEGLKVGLCWAGGKRVQDPKLVAMDEKRSISFEHIKPILDVPGCTFFSLQTGLAAEQLDGRVYDTMKGVKSWSDTAAIIANLDVVISVDTSVLHMAAAMGKPTFLLNKYWTCWRWMLERMDSPWYETIRIFRPKEPEDWTQVVNDAREALAQWQR